MKKIKDISFNDWSSFIKIAGLFLSVMIFYLLIPKMNNNVSQIQGIYSTHLLPNDFIIRWEVSWLFFSQLFSTFLSLIILIRIVKNLIDINGEKDINTKLITWYSLFGICFFLLITLILGTSLFLSDKYDENFLFSRWIYYGYSFFTILYYWGLDFFAYKSKQFIYFDKNKKDYTWKYNQAVLISFIIIILIGEFVKSQYTNELSAGLSGGASAFQLILAHILFDIKTYSI